MLFTEEISSHEELNTQQCRTCYNCLNGLPLLKTSSESSPQLSQDKSFAELLITVCDIDINKDVPVGQWPQFICLDCSEKLKTAYDFIQQTRKVNMQLQSIAGNDFNNDITCKDFMTEDLDIDTLSEAEERSDFFTLTCKKCDKVFGKPSQLRNHKLNAHLQGKKLSCRHCNSQFSAISSLKRHLRTVHRDKKKPKSTNEKSVSKPQSDIETNDGMKPKSTNGEIVSKPQSDIVPNDISEKLYTCSKCKRIFYSKKSLWRHKRIHHINKLNEFLCNYCGNKFDNLVKLKRHIYNFHHEVNSEEGRFRCDVCNCSFANRNRFSKHKKYKHKQSVAISTNEDKIPNDTDKESLPLLVYDDNHIKSDKEQSVNLKNDIEIHNITVNELVTEAEK